MKCLITGGAGFLGSNLARLLCEKNYRVVVIDNLSSGHKANIEDLNVDFIHSDINGIDKLSTPLLQDVDILIHLAAEVDNRFSWENPKKQLNSNIFGTLSVAEFARKQKIKKVIYSSTTTVYSKERIGELVESSPTNLQNTLYSASKLSGEHLLSAYSRMYEFDLIIIRLVGILGRGYSHGHIYDFVSQLLKNPSSLNVLGDGSQRKCYIDVSDVVNIIEKMIAENFFQIPNLIVNLSSEEWITVLDSVQLICSSMQLSPKVIAGTSKEGWIGDDPNMILNIGFMKSLGLSTNKSIRESIVDTTNWLVQNPWIFQKLK